MQLYLGIHLKDLHLSQPITIKIITLPCIFYSALLVCIFQPSGSKGTEVRFDSSSLFIMQQEKEGNKESDTQSLTEYVAVDAMSLMLFQFQEDHRVYSLTNITISFSMGILLGSETPVILIHFWSLEHS